MKSLFQSGKIKLIAVFVLLAVLLIPVVVLTPPVISQAASDNDPQPAKRTINVTGQGTVEVSPDIAYITLGVVTENKDAKAAQQENASIMDAVVKAIKSAGVAEEDIKTTGYSIYPKYDYNEKTGTSNIVGYTVRNNVQVTVRDITKVGQIIDIAADKGVNISNSISFGLSDYEKYYNEALKKAVESGSRKAKTIADALGIKLGAPVSVSESGSYVPTYRVYESAAAMKSADGIQVTTPISSGTIEVQAYVSMSYEY